MAANERSEAEHGDVEPKRSGSMAMCPMAETCRGMAKRPFPRFFMPLPGLMFIAIGVLILLIPALLVWFVALGSIAMGLMMLIFASFMTRMSAQFRRMQP
jgi:hypothetical protein